MAMPTKAKIVSVVLLLSVATGSAVYINRPESTSSRQSTDDAYVRADLTIVAPQVSGMIDKVLVLDGQKVRKGDLLATIDDRDLGVAVDAARAQVSGAEASVAGLAARLIQQEATINQARSLMAVDEAEVKLAQANQTRYRNLAADGSGTVQALQQAEAQVSIRMASQEKNRAGLQAAQQQVAILKADWEKSKAALAQARAAFAAAELTLSHTRILAPISGVVGQHSVRVGGFVNAGKPLLAIVPLDNVYVIANFRETQLSRVRAGQLVDIEVDALPGATLYGRVDSVGPASGASYSPVAPHNASGNFTKIVQRLPVRIRVKADQPELASLRVGMSVKPTIWIDE